jgi:hypothetical protein
MKKSETPPGLDDKWPIEDFIDDFELMENTGWCS